MAGANFLQKFLKQNKKSSHFEKLQTTFEQKKAEILQTIDEKHSDSLDWLKDRGVNLGEIKEDQVKRLAAATATGILLLSPGSMPLKELPDPEQAQVASLGKDVAKLASQSDPSGALAAMIREKLDTSGDSLKEAEMEKLLADNLGIQTRYELEGYRMNVNVGLIGAEQHLYRWQGDSLDAHTTTPEDQAMFHRSGIAPNRGAYGYFGPSGDKTAIQRERYYFAVQTFLSPNWQGNIKNTYNFFRFRKMIAINTKTGEAVVAVVGDAGPAKWTGKSYGGSPEVMHYLGLGKGPRKGEILILFVDDPNEKIPLGPVKIGSSGV
jgi:hypothetical protein